MPWPCEWAPGTGSFGREAGDETDTGITLDRTLTDFGLLVNLKIDLALLGVEVLVSDMGGGEEFIG